jgi:hypothetical protein
MHPRNAARVTPAAAERDPREFDRAGGAINPTHTTPSLPTPILYLLAELRCSSLRARLIQADIEAIDLALKSGLISPEQALEYIGVLRLVGVPLSEGCA